MSDIPACPSCGAILPKMPKARRKCPECRDWIYLKKPFKSDERILMTKKQADKVDQLCQEDFEVGYKQRMKEVNLSHLVNHESFLTSAANHPDANHVCINHSSNDAPDECPFQDKTIIPISQALTEVPLPCTALPCTCFYLIVFDDEIEVSRPVEKISWWKRLFS